MANYDDLLHEARELFTADEMDESRLRQDAREDIRFVAGRQWDERVKTEREKHDRPALTFNRLPTFVSQVTNEARQNRPAVKFAPAEDGDVKTARVMEGLARHIQYASKAPIAYQTAGEYSAMGGFGHFRLITDWIPGTWDQEVKFAPIWDPFTVYGVLLPACYGRKPTHAFVVEDLTHAEFKRQWPKAELLSIGFDSDVARSTGWINTQTVRVAEYWRIEVTKWRRLLQLSDGTTAYLDELKEMPPGVTVKRERSEPVESVRCYKVNGVEVLEDEETEWPGTRIPIFTALGRLIMVDDGGGIKPELISLIRFMRDPQRLLNYFKSGIAEQLALSSRAPWTIAEGQIEGYEWMWQQANQRNFSALIYKPQILGGGVVPPPQRNTFEPPIQALSVAAAQEIDDLKGIAGIFDASLGAQSNETSGVAITRRKEQMGLTNLHFIDNLHRAQDEAGLELAAVIPKVYDGDRMVRILGEDEKEEVVRLNGPGGFDLSIGKYDVRVGTGPNYTTQRQEAWDTLTQFAQAYPALVEIAGDIIFRNSDTPGASDIAERFKRRLPPELVTDTSNAPVPPQVAAQLRQAQQMIEQLTAALNEATDDLNTKRLELESKERIASLHEQVELIKTQAKLESQEMIEMLRQEIAALSTQINARLEQLRYDEPVKTDGDETAPAAQPHPDSTAQSPAVQI